MNFIDNVRIKQACELIMSFYFKTANIEYLRTRDVSVKEQAWKIMEETRENSIFSCLIRDYKWESLLKNESFLLLLDGAQNFSALNSFLFIPLKVLSESFPEETKMHIIPELLR